MTRTHLNRFNRLTRNVHVSGATAASAFYYFNGERQPGFMTFEDALETTIDEHGIDAVAFFILHTYSSKDYTGNTPYAAFGTIA
jgi:hypothetical protein